MRQIQFLDRLNDGTYVNVISSDNQQSLIVEKMLPNGEYFQDSGSRNYPNAKMLSEALRDSIGYGPAKDLLLRNGVEEDDPLMYLGKNNC